MPATLARSRTTTRPRLLPLRKNKPKPRKLQPRRKHKQRPPHLRPTPKLRLAAEEAAGSEEMSKLMEQYDEQHEAASQNEIIEVKVVAYTEHGVVVDLGGRPRG